MKRYLIAALAIACLFSAPAFAKNEAANMVFAQVTAPATTSTQTVTNTPTAPASVTTVVKGGTLAADVLQWLQVILVPIIGGALVGIAYKVMGFFGIKMEESNKAALNALVVNGLNQSAAKADAALRNNPRLDIDVKSQVIADAVSYVQSHGKDTIKALGLDADDPKAVEAIRARIQTAIIDPMTPTNPALDKIVDKPAAPSA